VINNKKHIIFLALFQLVVFMAPLAVKDFHNHIHLQSDNTNDSAYNKLQKPCAICNFEFVQFIAKSPFHIHYYIPSISVVISYIATEYYKIPYFSYHLRGPPKF